MHVQLSFGCFAWIHPNRPTSSIIRTPVSQAAAAGTQHGTKVPSGRLVKGITRVLGGVPSVHKFQRITKLRSFLEGHSYKTAIHRHFCPANGNISLPCLYMLESTPFCWLCFVLFPMHLGVFRIPKQWYIIGLHNGQCHRRNQVSKAKDSRIVFASSQFYRILNNHSQHGDTEFFWYMLMSNESPILLLSIS